MNTTVSNRCEYTKFLSKIPGLDLNSKTIVCKTVKQKNAYKVIILDSIRDLNTVKPELNFSHIDEEIIKIRMLSLKVAKQLAGEFRGNETKEQIAKKAYDDLKARIAENHKGFGSCVYYTSDDYSDYRWYEGRYLARLFFDRRVFPIFAFTSKDQSVIIRGKCFNGVTLVELKINSKEKYFIDNNMSIINSNEFINQITGYLEKKRCNDVSIAVRNALLLHQDATRRFERIKLAMLLDYQNEICDFDEVKDISKLLKSNIPFENWKRTHYVIARDILKFDFDDEHNGDELKWIIRAYFSRLGFIK